MSSSPLLSKYRTSLSKANVLLCLFILCLAPIVGAAPNSLNTRGETAAISTPPQHRHKTWSIFQGQAQIDAVTVLMLLGEATIWKTIWARFRSKRSHWRQRIFAISPGWTPLAATLFTAMNGSMGPPNLIFDRPPEGALSKGLAITNLDSGATHDAQNAILQCIWQTWCHGPRKSKQEHSDSLVQGFSVTREVGVVDLNLDALHLEDRRSVWLHAFCLFVQLVSSLVLGLTGRSFETFVVLLLALLGQLTLILSITPRRQAWQKTTRGHRTHPIMLHHKLDSMGVLFVRRVLLKGKEVSLEEFCWDSQAQGSIIDQVKLVGAGSSFMIFVAQIILVGWMSSQSRVYYLVLGGLGLIANTIEAASQPDWLQAFRSSFSGNPHCAPPKGSLMSAIGILVAGQFPSAKSAATLLYPDNARFEQSLLDLKDLLDGILCSECRTVIRVSQDSTTSISCSRQKSGELGSCSSALAAAAEGMKSKQLRDGVATVAHFLRSQSDGCRLPPIETSKLVAGEQTHAWQLCNVI